jgi:hypothetical protein
MPLFGALFLNPQALDLTGSLRLYDRNALEQNLQESSVLDMPFKGRL